MGDNYDSFYSGSYSSLDPIYTRYPNMGYPSIDTGSLVSTTSPMHANQTNEFATRIKEGVSNVEVGAVSPQVLETTPKQQFDEIRALAKLTGVTPTLHAPIQEMDPSGFNGQQSSFGDEEDRLKVENRFKHAIDIANQMNPGGNTPVVIHSSNGAPHAKVQMENGKVVEKEVYFVDKETGKLQKSTDKEQVHWTEVPGKGLGWEGERRNPRDDVITINSQTWRESMTNAATNLKMANEIIDDARMALVSQKQAKDYKDLNAPEGKSKVEMAEMQLGQAGIFVHNTQLAFQGLFEKAWKYGTEKQKKKLKEKAEEWMEMSKKVLPDKKKITPEDGPIILDAQNKLLNKQFADLQMITDNGGAPQMFEDSESYAKKKASKTLGNLAYYSYKNAGGEGAPVIAIENVYPEMAFSNAKELEGLVKETRKKFEKQLIKNEGMDEKEAKKISNKLVGATWDVGHINLYKRYGYSDKDIAKETKKIAENVKHLHLTDNFGYDDTHLTPGMGNVPFKEHLKELEKAGVLGKVKKVIEAGGLVNPQMQLSMSPFRETLSAFGAPMGAGSYFGQVENSSGGYFGYPLAQFPDKHFSMYGSGFSTLPEELGGQIPGTGSRFAGTPNA
jgi:sugar phosphate isomerase/epimerase